LRGIYMEPREGFAKGGKGDGAISPDGQKKDYWPERGKKKKVGSQGGEERITPSEKKKANALGCHFIENLSFRLKKKKKNPLARIGGREKIK